MAWWTKYTNEQIDQAIANALGMSGGSAASLIHQASVTLTNAQINSLVGTSALTNPVIVPGLSGCVCEFDVGRVAPLNGMAYSNVDGAFAFYVGLARANADAFNLAGDTYQLLGNGDPGFLHFGAQVHYDGYRTIRPDDIVGESLWFRLYGQSVPLADGDAGNTLPVNVRFFVFHFAQNRYLTTAESGWNETTRTFS